MNKENYTFKVGDKPKWTEEMIKALPHGTKLRCANVVYKDEFEYNGECLINGRIVRIGNIEMYFISNERYAEIITIPEQPNFESGEIVEIIDETGLPENNYKMIYSHYFSGRHWCYDESEIDTLHGHFNDELRKFDPDKKYREIAQKMTNNCAHYSANDNRYIIKEYVESMLIEALKKQM